MKEAAELWPQSAACGDDLPSSTWHERQRQEQPGGVTWTAFPLCPAPSQQELHVGGRWWGCALSGMGVSFYMAG